MDFTPEDERLIKEKWEELLQSCTKICKNDEDWEFIKRAFFLAKEAMAECVVARASRTCCIPSP